MFRYERAAGLQQPLASVGVVRQHSGLVRQSAELIGDDDVDQFR